MPTARVLKVRSCVVCGARFETVYEARHCSSVCAANGCNHRPVNDGGPAIRGPRTEAYESRCAMCGRLQQEFELDAEGARNRVLVGFPACLWCKGLVLLEPAHAGQRGSVDAERRAVVHSTRITPIPRRRVSA